MALNALSKLHHKYYEKAEAHAKNNNNANIIKLLDGEIWAKYGSFETETEIRKSNEAAEIREKKQFQKREMECE